MSITDVTAALDNALAVAQAYAPPVVIPPQPTTTGNAILAAMAPGSMKMLVKAMPFPAAVGEPMAAYHVTDQAGLTYDDVNYRIWRPPGGGHAGTANESMDYFDLVTLQWVNVYPPIAYADRTLGNYDGQRGAWTVPALHPADRHNEQCNPFIPELNQLLVMKTTDGNGTTDVVGDWPTGTQLGTQIGPGANGYATYWACNRQNSSGEVAHWHVDTKQWTFHGAQAFPAFPKEMGEQQYGWPAAVYDAKSKLVWVFCRDAMWTYDPFNPGPTTRKRIKTLGIAGMGSAMALVYYPPTDKYYWCAHFTGTPPVWRYYEIALDRVTPTNTTVKLVTPTGTAAGQSGLTSTTEMAVDYDQFTKKLWAGPFLNNGAINFTWLDPATMTVGSVSPTNATDQGLAPGHCLFHMMRVDQRTGAMIWVDKGAARTWAYKPQ